MTLEILIKRLKAAYKLNPKMIVKHGFAKPNSYRGYYEDVAFEPAENVTLKSMLKHAKSALNKTFTGYKGGEFTMNNYTETWIASYGTCSGAGSIGDALLRYMLDE